MRAGATLQARVAAHSLTWLAVGNGAGLLAAALLLRPEWNEVLGEAGYGRWMSLHLALLLYGWCSLPLVGVLLRAYLPSDAERGGRLAVDVWSGTLLYGAAAWLAGGVSGKLFLEWSGVGRWLLVGSLSLLAAVLAGGLAGRIVRGEETRSGIVGKGVLLLALACVPPVFWLATDPGVYPPINPDSGGSTGSSLLGSSLGIVAVFCSAPVLMGLRRRPGGAPTVRWTWALLPAHFTLFLILGHGDRSHHEPLQIAALASLVLWWPVLRRYLRLWSWPEGSLRWLRAMGVWGGALLATAVLMFLPGLLEEAKFTDLLVAHAHLAMAGLVSAFLALVLLGLADAAGLRSPLTARLPFVLWQAGAAAMIGALTLAGFVEAGRPGGLGTGNPVVQVLYGIRWLAGGSMFAASLGWARGSWRSLSGAFGGAVEPAGVVDVRGRTEGRL
ncbi:MAG: hypothetical protein R2991_02700 [Thermoanaerobaculia bacterium]